MGRAIARKPKVFLLDEPLSNLDAQLRDDTRAELKQLHQQVGITTIYVTHDQVEAMTLADKIVVLNRGKIQQIGDPQSIYNRPANRMVATFLGSPPMNILPAIFMGEMFRVGEQFLPIPVGIRDGLLLRQGQGFDLGIRPEDIRIIEPQRRRERREEEEGLVAMVKVVEPLGREILIRVGFDGVDVQVNMQVGGSWRGKVGDRISIQFDLARLFVFDPATGDTLYP